VSVHVGWPAGIAAVMALLAFVAWGAPARRAAALRGLAAAALILVLGGATVERPRPAGGACVVTAIDVSGSMQGAGMEAARGFLARLMPELGADDVVGSVAFAGRARVLADPARPNLTALIEGTLSDLDRDDTDLAGALATAAPLCPDGRQAAIVLVTDGVETIGSVLAEATFGEPRVPVFPVVPSAVRLPATSIRRLLAPPVAAAGTVLPIEAVIESRAIGTRSAALALAANGRALLPVPLELPPGVSVVRLPYRFDESGQYLLEARLLAAPGEPAPPAIAAAAIAVTPPRRALVASERARPALARALAGRGMEVEAVSAAGLGERAGQLDRYHVIVLVDVPRAAVGDATLAAIARRVAAGGGLVVAGGPHLFGDGGFAGSPLAPALPVTLVSQRPAPREREPIALEILIDRSNSMGYGGGRPGFQYGEKMAYAKQAALAVIAQLGPRDVVGAIAFDAEAHELAPLVPLAQGRAALEERIARLEYGGGTDFKDALERARAELVATGRRVRHVLLLTDGDTNRRAADHDDVIAALGRDAVTVTAIRIGDDTENLGLLEHIARATGGAFHHVGDLDALPELMISDAEHLMDRAADRPELPVRVGEWSPMLAGITEAELPAVTRWAVTRPKPGAEVRLWIDAGDRRDPVLVTWQHELGRVAVLPLDFDAGAAAWTAWSGFAKLASQLAGWTAARALPFDRRVVARAARDGTVVELETTTDEQGPFVLRVEDREAALRPTGRRRFAGLVPPLEAGVHPAVLVAPGREDRVDVVVPPAHGSGREYASAGANVALLERLAARTGGRVGAEPADVLAARGGARHERVPLDGVLVPLALALVLADVALRRLGARP
jgi:Ca-activated chloride channel homolog